jgi:hypothetical protein
VASELRLQRDCKQRCRQQDSHAEENEAAALQPNPGLVDRGSDPNLLNPLGHASVALLYLTFHRFRQRSTCMLMKLPRRVTALGLCLFVVGCQQADDRSAPTTKADNTRSAAISDLERRVTSLERQLGGKAASRESLSSRTATNSSGPSNFQPAIPGNRHYLVRGNNRALYTDKARCEAARDAFLRAYSEAGDGQVEQSEAQPELRCVAA